MTETPPPPAETRSAATSPIVALCGGVGAARFLTGLVQEVAPERVHAIVNTGDDREFYGVQVCPDLDIVSYTLAGRVDTELGYGLKGDTHQLIERLEKLGHEAWFRLGDQDYANCLHRTQRMQEGAGLAEITRELTADLGVAPRLLPMSEDPCPTLVELESGAKMHFEEYMIREGAPDCVRSVDLSAAERATPAPGVLEAIAAASAILICPSNPVVSIGPILAVPGIRDALLRSDAPCVAVSPIVGDAPIKGPARQLLSGIGVAVSAAGVAGHYRELIGGFVFDERDAAQEEEIRQLGLATACTDSIMRDREAAARLARSTLALAGRLA